MARPSKRHAPSVMPAKRRMPRLRRRTAETVAAPVFAALGDRTRLFVVLRLCAGGPMSIAVLTQGVGVTRQAVTKHLHVLDRAGLVRSERRGRERVWAIEPAALDTARACLDRISLEWDQALASLNVLCFTGKR